MKKDERRKKKFQRAAKVGAMLAKVAIPYHSDFGIKAIMNLAAALKEEADEAKEPKDEAMFREFENYFVTVGITLAYRAEGALKHIKKQSPIVIAGATALKKLDTPTPTPTPTPRITGSGSDHEW
jgi:hypothetical protein